MDLVDRRDHCDPGNTAGFVIMDKLQQRLSNFQVDHHESVLNCYKEKMEWWRVQTDVDKSRCKVCWLRSHQCYCETLKQKKATYDSWEPKPNVNVCMYYNPVEIARSANTAHVLEATCPGIVYSIIQGDLQKEKELMDDIEREYRDNEPQTVIMFPSKDAKLLSEWMAARPTAVSDKPVRLVMLDGTYPGATRIAKYMIKCCAVRKIPAPLVKLDLEGDSCKSAVAGMMYQPGKDKICTYQATVMAMQQAGVDPALCSSLHRDLQDWIGYILTSKVKLGKTKPRNSMKHVMDVTPDEFVAQKLVRTLSCATELHAGAIVICVCCVIYREKHRPSGDPTLSATPSTTATCTRSSQSRRCWRRQVANTHQCGTRRWRRRCRCKQLANSLYSALSDVPLLHM